MVRTNLDIYVIIVSNVCIKHVEYTKYSSV